MVKKSMVKQSTINPNSSKWKAAIPGLLSFILLLCILIYPKEAYQAALSGLDIWLRSVFPALLPFFIASEIMIGLGVVDFLSVLLTPVMGPLFRCSGSSSFIWIMSITSGYPTGARLVALFRKQGKLCVDEGQRILSFCSTSGPLFMMGAVSIGMMGSLEGGKIILFSHYCAAIILGLIFRNYHSKKRSSKFNRQISSISIQTALSELYNARKKDGRPIGELMGDAVRNSVNALLMVGGFIILFSVIIDLLVRIQFIHYGAIIVSFLLKPLNIDFSLVKALVGSLFEVTIGSKMVSQAAVSLQQKIAAVSFVIGWSGFSIHAQTASILSGSGIRFGIYLLNKFFHGVLAALISYPVTLLFYPKAAEVFNPIIPLMPSWKDTFFNSIRLLSFGVVCILLLSIFTYVWSLIRKTLKDTTK